LSETGAGICSMIVLLSVLVDEHWHDLITLLKHKSGEYP